MEARASAKTRSANQHSQLGRRTRIVRRPARRGQRSIGILLGTVGVIGLWGIGFWSPELVRNYVLKDYSSADKDWYASMGLIMQNAGAFFGMYGFGMLAHRIGRRGTFAVAFVLGFISLVGVYGFMTRPEQIWWMLPLLGFGTMMAFGGYGLYFPELFPTRLRSTGTGFCYNVARYLAASGPFVLPLLAAAYMATPGTPRADNKLSSLTVLSSLGGADYAFRYAAMTLSGVYLLGLLVIPFAPETRGQPLPE